MFFQPFWSKGYAADAVSALVAHLTEHSVVEQRAYVTLGNGASVRVAETSRFVLTRIIPGGDAFRGVTYDDMEFARGRKTRLGPARRSSGQHSRESDVLRRIGLGRYAPLAAEAG